MKKFLNFLWTKPKKRLQSERLQEVKSQKVILRKKTVLSKDSDSKSILSNLNSLGIQTKNKSIRQVEQEIDKKIMANISFTLSHCNDNVKVKNIGDKFIEQTDNSNLIRLKIHINSLKSWLEDSKAN